MPQPIADWTKPADYPSKAGMTRWAFEFLRRNHNYQRDFLEYLRVCDSIVPGFNPFLKPNSEAEYDEKYLHLRNDDRYAVYDPPRHEGETEGDFSRRVVKWTWTPLPTWYARKWGLSTYLFNPFADYDSFSGSFDIHSFFIAGPGWEGFKHIQASHHSQAFVIDYRQSLKRQIDAIKLYATHHQKWLEDGGHIATRVERRKKLDGELLRQYLRCLDATDALATPGEIASLLSNENPKGFDPGHIAKQIAVAEKLRNEGYRFLLVTGK